jgi:hypothetical protein
MRERMRGEGERKKEREREREGKRGREGGREREGEREGGRERGYGSLTTNPLLFSFPPHRIRFTTTSYPSLHFIDF